MKRPKISEIGIIIALLLTSNGAFAAYSAKGKILFRGNTIDGSTVACRKREKTWAPVSYSTTSRGPISHWVTQRRRRST